MKDDLVKRLRANFKEGALEAFAPGVIAVYEQERREAADEIERLQTLVEKLTDFAKQRWETLEAIDAVLRGEEPDMDGALWPSFVTKVRDRIEGLEDALEDVSQYISRADWNHLKPNTLAALGGEG